MATFTLLVNDRWRQVTSDPAMPLLWALRDRLGLTGTKFGCGMGVCGACTVHENGRAVRSCLVTMADTVGRRYTTIEGLSPDNTHPCQQAWLTEDVAQCGFCQPGMIMAAAAFLKDTPSPTDDDIKAGITNLCRCGTYPRIKKAILRAAAKG